jgi:hypothetical protein
MLKLRSTILLACLLAVYSCAQQGDPLISTHSSVRIEGIAAECYATRSRIFLVIMHGFRNIERTVSTSSSSAAGSSAKVTEINGEFATSDGRNVKWDCTTTDGRKGEVTISGIEYDLAEGNIFLVTTEQASIKVNQLIRELGRPHNIIELVEALAASDPEIREYINAIGKQE